jgi:hypothetical protein
MVFHHVNTAEVSGDSAFRVMDDVMKLYGAMAPY